MGFFTKLVGFIRNRTSFRKEAEPVPLIALSGWVKELRDKVSLESRIDIDLKLYLQQLDDCYIKLDHKLIEMSEQASLWQKQEKELAKQTDHSIKRLLELLYVKERPSIDTVFLYNERLSEVIDKLLLFLDNVGESLGKSGDEMVYGEALSLFKDYFSTEIQKLLASKQDFEIRLFKSGLRSVQTLSHKVELLHQSVLRRDKLEQKLKEKSERRERAQAKKKEKEMVLNDLKSHPLYSGFSQVQDRKNQLQSDLNKHLDEVRLLFLNLNPVLLDYKKMGSNIELLDSYLDDSALAFVRDDGLAVVHLLEHLRAVILQGKIVLDQDELLCAQSTLDLATASYLSNLQQQCFSLKLQLESFEDHSNVDKTYSLKVQDAHYRYSHFVQQVERLSEEITQLEEEFKEKKEQIRREQQLIENLVWIGLQRVIKVVM